ncbi:ATP-dependent endonuclease, partial [Salmonella enterica]|uniref:ATP-dependent nuclease n=1 Tax=Salmonella enterica TaxID=28901 RepID=UPI000A9EFC13
PNMGKLKETLESLQNILALGNGTTIDIEALPIKIWDLMSKCQIVLSGQGGDMKFPLKRHGQGTQSLAVLFLFQAYIDVLMKPTFSPTTTALLAIEEPEAHLHPHAVRALGKTLSKIDAQKVITSHSPYLVQNSSLLDIRVFRRRGSATEIFYVR